MPTDRIISAASAGDSEERFNQSLRPTKLEDYVGQPRLVEKLGITLQAVKQRGEAMAPRGSARRRSRTSSPLKWARASPSPAGPQ